MLLACGGEAVVDGSPAATGGRGGAAGAGGTGGTTTTSTTTGTGAAGGTGSADCSGGFCRALYMSSCGDPDYSPHFELGECSTLAHESGYCCLSDAADAGTNPCTYAGGYCTAWPQCEPGYVQTQMGCEIAGSPGSCCLPGE